MICEFPLKSVDYIFAIFAVVDYNYIIKARPIIGDAMSDHNAKRDRVNSKLTKGSESSSQKKDTLRSGDKPTPSELNKIGTQKKADDLKAATRLCKTCGKEIAPVKRCFGHGGGGGGGGSSSSGGESSEKAGRGGMPASAIASGQMMDSISPVDNGPVRAVDGKGVIQPQPLPLPDKKFNPEIISEMLSKGLLLIDNNRELGILTITLQCSPRFLSAEQSRELKKYIDAILQELRGV